MTRFIDRSERIVVDAIDGALAAGRGDTTRLDGFPDTKVVLRRDQPTDRVAVISGGGSGHEPAQAGFVGRGMLSAAVAGELFTSPSVDAVLAAILAVTGDAGCLLIVTNYTGDRLNFGLAAERARQMGYRVEMVIAADDIALANPQPRGIAGTLFAHKVAGYHAENGADLAAVKAAVDAVLAGTRSLGLALATCDLLTQPPRAQDSTPELGLGIHGEPGAQTIDVDSAGQAVELLVERLAAALPDDHARIALLINNLGSVTPLEMNIVARDVLASRLGQRCGLVIGPAGLMTALNMYGFSLSALALTEDIDTALRAPVAPAAWPGAAVPATPAPVAMPDTGAVETWPAQHEPNTERLLRAVCEALLDAESALNEADARIGDGDTGTTAAIGARAVRDALAGDGLPLASPAALLRALERIAERSMGGSSGVLLSLFFTAAGNALEAGETLAEALTQGAASMQHYGGAARGDRTLLDALLPALEAWAEHQDVSAAARSARHAAEATREIEHAGAGRASYLRADTLAGHADPGAIAVAIAFEAAAGDAA